MASKSRSVRGRTRAPTCNRRTRFGLKNLDKRRTRVRFLILRKADRTTEAGVMPNHDMLAVMSNYMEEMGKAGVLLSAEGFQPSSKGARVKFSQGKPKVTNGPFDKSDGLVAGSCLIHGIYAHIICLKTSVLVAFVSLINSCPEFAAGLDEDTEFVAGNIEWYMSKTALAREQKAISRKIYERWHQALPNDLRGFNRITSLVDYAKGQAAFEIPLLPQIHQIVAERAVLERDFINLDTAECGHQIGIFGEIYPPPPGVTAANV